MPPDVSVSNGRCVLEATSISVRFGGVQALQDVSIPVAAGAVSGLIGPNGAGKTTFFDVLTGLRRPDSGRIALEGRDITRVGTAKRARLGIARTFQRLELFWSLNVEDNVLVGAEATVQWWKPDLLRRGKVSPLAANRADPSKDELSGRALVAELLDRVGLSDVAKVQVGALPTGQARLVELARALSTNPQVLLLDEPGSGLDDSESAVLGSLLVDLARGGMAVLLVEHDMSLLMKVSDTITVLDAGAVIASGKPEEVRQNQAVRAAYLGDMEEAS